MRIKLLTFCLFLFFFRLWGGTASEIKLQFVPAQTPQISSFPGFKGMFSSGLASSLVPGSLRLLINGEDLSYALETEKDSKTGELMFSFSPFFPLEWGKLQGEIQAQQMDGKILKQQFSLLIDPAADPELGFWAKKLKKDPREAESHYQIARLYEQKSLLKDALAHYQKALELNPRHLKAQAACFKLFSLLASKILKQEKLTLRVTQTQLEPKLPLVLIKLEAVNHSSKPVEVKADKAYIITDGENKEKNEKSLYAFAAQAYKQKLITAEEYARLTFYLEKQSFKAFPGEELPAKTSAWGYLAFPLSQKSYQEFTLFIQAVLPSGIPYLYRFPFKKP